jgi:hypothetical protein
MLEQPGSGEQNCALLALHPDADMPYLERRIREESWAIMASKISGTESDQPVIDMAELGARIARRRAELGITDADLPRNSGKRRTASKKALLKAIKDAGGEW